MEEKKYYNFQEILDFIGFNFEFEKENKKYPFNKSKENVTFSWGQIIIPTYGIREMVQNKISDIKEEPLSKLKMIYQIPFIEESNGKPSCGIINKDISLIFKYDKEYKYGNINKSIYETCFWILEHATKTNNFYIITDDMIQYFMSYYVIDNQWGLGSTFTCSPYNEKMM